MISPEIIILFSGLVIFYLLYKNRELAKKILKPEIQYVDTSGIIENPPKNYIDVRRNKTINFKLDKYTVSVCHLPVLRGISYVEIISSLYLSFLKSVENKPSGKIMQLAKTLVVYKTYMQIVKVLYMLTKSFVDKKIGYKKALFKRAKDDSEFIMDICEQINDYWMLVKKKTFFSGKGGKSEIDTWREVFLELFRSGCPRRDIEATTLREYIEYINKLNNECIELEKLNGSNRRNKNID